MTTRRRFTADFKARVALEVPDQVRDIAVCAGLTDLGDFGIRTLTVHPRPASGNALSAR